MCSLKLHEAVFGPDGEDAIRSAIADVAERSFFATADPCDEARLAELASPHDRWLVATVRFDEGPCAGEVSCRLPGSLADRLFDAFSGREPEEPAPDPDQLFDLVGEFANMICGAWLTRAASHQSFSLSKPVVTSCPGGCTRAEAARPGLAMAIDDLPFVIDVRFGAVPARPAATLAQA